MSHTQVEVLDELYAAGDWTNRTNPDEAAFRARKQFALGVVEAWPEIARALREPGGGDVSTPVDGSEPARQRGGCPI